MHGWGFSPRDYYYFLHKSFESQTKLLNVMQNYDSFTELIFKNQMKLDIIRAAFGKHVQCT